MIEILVGPIASGKSTYAVQRAHEGALIINDDSIVNALHANQYGLYDKTLKPLYKQLEMIIISTGIALGRDIIIDRPCCKRKTRARYLEIGHSLEVPVYAVLFGDPDNPPETYAKRRFESDSRGQSLEFWIEVAKRHAKLFEHVNVSEMFDEIRIAPVIL